MHEKSFGKLVANVINELKMRRGKRLNILYKPERIPFTKEMLASIDLQWEKARKKSPGMYNGKLYHVSRFEVSGKEILLHTIDSNYKEYVGTREPIFSETFGTQHSVDPLSVGAVLITSDDQIHVGRREFVDTWEGFYSTVAGYLQLPEEIGKPPDADAALRREIFEEAGVTDEEITASDFIGLAETSYLAYEVHLAVSSSAILARRPVEKEFAKFEFVPMNAKALAKFLTQNQAQIMPVALTSLLYLGVLHFGSTWEHYTSDSSG